MIIKMTINDSDLTPYIVKFVEGFKFNNYWNIIDYYDEINKLDLNVWYEVRAKLSELFTKALHDENKMTTEELNLFTKYVKEALALYLLKHYVIEGADFEDYKNALSVECLTLMNNEPQRDEVVYYFLQQDKYLVC